MTWARHRWFWRRRRPDRPARQTGPLLNDDGVIPCRPGPAAPCARCTGGRAERRANSVTAAQFRRREVVPALSGSAVQCSERREAAQTLGGSLLEFMGGGSTFLAPNVHRRTSQ